MAERKIIIDPVTRLGVLDPYLTVGVYADDPKQRVTRVGSTRGMNDINERIINIGKSSDRQTSIQPLDFMMAISGGKLYCAMSGIGVQTLPGLRFGVGEALAGFINSSPPTVWVDYRPAANWRTERDQHCEALADKFLRIVATEQWRITKWAIACYWNIFFPQPGAVNGPTVIRR